MPSFTITRYSVRLFSSRPSADKPEIATIQLYSASPDSTTHGWMHFYPDGVELPPPVILENMIQLYYHAAQLGVVLQFLREESPLMLSGFESTASLWTLNHEPVGEEEGPAG